MEDKKITDQNIISDITCAVSHLQDIFALDNNLSEEHEAVIIEAIISLKNIIGEKYE